MKDFESRKIVEALRSGISSHEVGLYFSSARPRIMEEIQRALDEVASDGKAAGRVITGKYGEGKTHLLNTVRGIAHSRNMVVSSVTISKETPLSNAGGLYGKIIQGTYLPEYPQPGIAPALGRLSLNTQPTPSLLEYTLTHLTTNKLYYLLKSYLGTQDEEEKYLLGADLEGDFIAPALLRKIYRRVFGEPAVFNGNFVRSKHFIDYLTFLSRCFHALGYSGWVILFDEAELIGRLGRKSREKAYQTMHNFLRPTQLEGVYSIFALGASFVPDVIEAKQEHFGVEQDERLLPAEKTAILEVLYEIEGATQLAPLTREETAEILTKILLYHGKAYGWEPKIGKEEFMQATDPYGYLLRTRIRAAIEMLDQLYQYGTVGDIRVSELGEISFAEEEGSTLEEFL